MPGLDYPFQQYLESRKALEKENDYIQRCTLRGAYDVDAKNDEEIWHSLEEEKRIKGCGVLTRENFSPQKIRIIGGRRVLGENELPKNKTLAPLTVDDLRLPYRVPTLGEPVRLEGLKGRPQANGMCGEVVSNGADADGFVKVLLWDDGSGGCGGLKGRTAAANATLAGFTEGKVVKVRHSCLKALHVQRSLETLKVEKSLKAVPGDYGSTPDWASAKTLSEAASEFSRGSRSLSSAGQSFLSGSTGSLPSQWHRQHLQVPKKTVVKTKVIL